MEELPEVSSLRVCLRTANAYGIWTGGATAGEMDAVKATSVLGGLRFWTGALLRANGAVCKDKPGQYDAGKKSSGCALSDIFGCTGLSRAFSLSVKTDKQINPPRKKATEQILLTAHKYRDKNGKEQTPKCYLTYGYEDTLEISLAVRRPRLSDGQFALPPEVPAALYLMIKYGTLGAYDQYGCGLVHFASSEEEEKLRALCPPPGDAPAAQGVSLRDFFFFKGKASGNPKQALGEIRYRIREALHKDDITPELRHWFCGDLGNRNGKHSKTYGTNYAFTVNPDGKLYGWGQYPRSGAAALYPGKRDAVLNTVRDVLKQPDLAGKSLVWRECASPRDTAATNQLWPQFYSALVRDSWRDA